MGQHRQLIEENSEIDFALDSYGFLTHPKVGHLRIRG